MESQVCADSRQLHYLLEASAGQLEQPDQGRERGVSLPTAREEAVVRLVAEGMGNREITQQLNLSDHTVKNYIFRIFEKLGLSNRVELVLYAIARLNHTPQQHIPVSKPSIFVERNERLPTGNTWN